MLDTQCERLFYLDSQIPWGESSWRGQSSLSESSPYYCSSKRTRNIQDYHPWLSGGPSKKHTFAPFLENMKLAMDFCVEFQAVKFSQGEKFTYVREHGKEIKIHLEQVLHLIDPFDFAPALTSHRGFISQPVEPLRRREPRKKRIYKSYELLTLAQAHNMHVLLIETMIKE